MSITVANYIFSAATPRVPSISLDGTVSTTTTLADTYENTDAPAYADAVIAYVTSRENLRTQFMYDVLKDLSVPLATIDLTDNKVELNVKANELWAEAIRNVNLNSTSGMTTAIANAARLLSILLTEPGGDALVIETTETPVVYSSTAVEITYDGVTGVYFYLDVPNAVGSARAYTGSNSATMTWSSVLDGWVVVDGSDTYNGTYLEVNDSREPGDVDTWTLEGTGA